MKKIVTISYTDLDAPGGVPRWNRDFHSSFVGASKEKQIYQAEHFCWDNFPITEFSVDHIPEWEKAKLLNNYLLSRKWIRPNDIIVADGFWLSGLEHLPYTVSVCHGIWGHVTKADVDAGKQPDFPLHHAAQVAYRQKLWNQKKRMVAVSDFIADNMKDIWGWEVPVINTGIDLDLWRPHEDQHILPVIVHGINDKGNINKGWDHIEAVKASMNIKARILSFDEFVEQESRVLNRRSNIKKNEVLGIADLCLIPSAYEGNSLFCLEALACNVPIVSYNVGLPYRAWNSDADIGVIIDRRNRFPLETVNAVIEALENINSYKPREWVSQFSIENFRTNWRSYIEEMIK